MVFSSIIFLYLFLPAVILLYYLVPKQVKNLILLIFSLIFYAWGEPRYILLMAVSIVMNYIIGRFIAACDGKAGKNKIWLTFGIVLNVGFLVVFKYLDFLTGLINLIPKVNLPAHNLALPIGISFYTFQAMSYLIDVYRGDETVENNLLYFATYISFFPQLIAGPIVRYSDMRDQLKEKRKVTVREFSSGAFRFSVGLGKKVLIANALGELVSTLEARSAADLGLASAWLLVIAYTLQLYFDFSGYSDMAIGLGRLFGFTFPENFRHPYESSSITEFWRRWHITLGGWFRNYVYIPMGGNRHGLKKQILAIVTVWALTGLWHGASMNFVIWGLYYGLLLLIEKFILKRYLVKLPSAVRHLMTLFLVTFGWGIFIYPDIKAGPAIYPILFGMGKVAGKEAGMLFSNYFAMLVIAAAGSSSLPALVCKKIFGRNEKVLIVSQSVWIAVMFVLSTASIISGGYNPFLYFRF